MLTWFYIIHLNAFFHCFYLLNLLWRNPKAFKFVIFGLSPFCCCCCFSCLFVCFPYLEAFKILCLVLQNFKTMSCGVGFFHPFLFVLPRPFQLMFRFFRKTLVFLDHSYLLFFYFWNLFSTNTRPSELIL